MSIQTDRYLEYSLPPEWQDHKIARAIVMRYANSCNAKCHSQLNELMSGSYSDRRMLRITHSFMNDKSIMTTRAVIWARKAESFWMTRASLWSLDRPQNDRDILDIKNVTSSEWQSHSGRIRRHYARGGRIHEWQGHSGRQKSFSPARHISEWQNHSGMTIRLMWSLQAVLKMTETLWEDRKILLPE